MRRRRARGLGCLGCVPVSVLLPFLVVGFLIYWLMNRNKTAQSAQTAPAPAPRGTYCPGCGRPVTDADAFCPGCGAKVR